MSRKRPAHQSFKYAMEGIHETLKNEPNFRVHLIAGATALVGGILFRFNSTEWLILLLTISSVIILELINTAIEALVDLASPAIHPKAKIAKDVAAAAVLFSAVVSLVVGMILFLPKILTIVQR